MKFDTAIDNAARNLDAAEHEPVAERAGTLLTTANTWVRIAELLHHRDADKTDQQ